MMLGMIGIFHAFVMAGLGPATHDFFFGDDKFVGTRAKPGHDGCGLNCLRGLQQ